MGKMDAKGSMPSPVRVITRMLVAVLLFGGGYWLAMTLYDTYWQGQFPRMIIAVIFGVLVFGWLVFRVVQGLRWGIRVGRAARDEREQSGHAS